MFWVLRHIVLISLSLSLSLSVHSIWYFIPGTFHVHYSHVLFIDCGHSFFISSYLLTLCNPKSNCFSSLKNHSYCFIYIYRNHSHCWTPTLFFSKVVNPRSTNQTRPLVHHKHMQTFNPVFYTWSYQIYIHLKCLNYSKTNFTLCLSVIKFSYCNLNNPWDWLSAGS